MWQAGASRQRITDGRPSSVLEEWSVICWVANKANNNGRAVVIAILEEWPVICSVAVAAGAMIMAGIMLYNDWPAAQ